MKQSHKTLLLWLFLIVMFLGVHSLFAPADPANAQAGSESWQSPAVILGCSAVVFGLLLAMVYINRRAAVAFNTAAADAFKLLATGEYARAESALGALRERFQRTGNLRAVGTFNHAYALCRVGQFDRAASMYLEADREARKHAAALRPNLACQLAVLQSLRGDLDEARRWVAEAEKRKPQAVQHREVDAFVVVANSVIEMRSGHADVAARSLESRWRELEGALIGEILRPIRVLRAFAVAQAGVRDAGAAEPILTSLRPTQPGEFTWLGTAWPEMAAFVAANGL